MRWSKFKDKDARDIFDIIGQKVFPFIKTINSNKSSAFSRYMEDAMFLMPTPQITLLLLKKNLVENGIT